MDNYGTPDHEGVTGTWDLVQTSFHCCGVKTWDDWKTKWNNGSVPDSCCKGGAVEDCGKTTEDESKFNTEGCYAKFTDLFSNNLNYVGGKTKTTLQMFVQLKLFK